MDLRIKYKYRFVLQHGRIKRNGDEYIFLALPGAHCPILTMTNRSKWELVEFLYYALNYQY